MYSKSETSELKTAFWRSLGAYIKPIANANGERINWINYKTGVKHVYFRMNVSNISANIAIVINHPIEKERCLIYERFLSLKPLFMDVMQKDWQWQPDVYNESGIVFSRIFDELRTVTVFDKNDWPAIISFLKSRIIALDKYWMQIIIFFNM